jgi:hypothetical protein
MPKIPSSVKIPRKENSHQNLPNSNKFPPKPNGNLNNNPYYKMPPKPSPLIANKGGSVNTPCASSRENVNSRER